MLPDVAERLKSHEGIGDWREFYELDVEKREKSSFMSVGGSRY
jgi:hypothetical protein